MSIFSKPHLETKDLSQEAKSNDAENKTTKHDIGSAARLGLWSLAIGFGGFLIWASLAPLDEGVASQGVVALDTKRKTVQHLNGGIVEQVLVREGDEVKEGQLLLKLDEGVARANYQSSRQSYLGLLAVQARLQTEQQGKNQIIWPAELVSAMNDPQIQQQVTNEQQLLNTRKMLVNSDLRSIEENIQGQEAMLDSYARMLISREQQLRILNEELDHLRHLVKDGYAPRNRQLELERSVADTNASIADLQGNTMRTRSSISELRQRLISRRQEYRKEIETQLADVNRQVLAEEEKYRAVKNDLSRTEIRSPASGQVVGLTAQTVTGVVQPGEKLMDIVPRGAPLMLEVQVPPHMIDRVHPKMAVDVRFSSFANTPQLVVEGKLESISGDLLSDPKNNLTYYLARVEVTQEGVKALGSRQLHPGMPVEVILKGGERSVMTYLLHPLTKRLAASMTEE